MDITNTSIALGLLIALGAGFISFVSQCVLPLVPAYLSFVSGLSAEDLRKGSAGHSVSRVLAPSVAFVLGFSLIFIAMGASATALGGFLLDRVWLLSKIAGAIVILLGLHMIGLFRLKFLQVEKKLDVSKRPAGIAGAFVVGVAFAFGWTPCVGPVLAGILAYAANQETLWRGILLLAAYSLGLGIPFLIAGLAINRFIAMLARVGRYLRIAEIASGLLLVLLGALIISDNLTRISQYFGFLSRFAK